MTNIISAPINDGLSRKNAGHMSMISILAISVGLAAAPAHSQDMTSPSDMPMQSPVAAPQPTAAPAPTTQSAPVISMPAAKTDVMSPATPNRAEALATKGGFNAATVAPEALAQIESEQQARKAAAAKSAAAPTAGPARTTAPVTRGAANSAADSRSTSIKPFTTTPDVIAPPVAIDSTSQAIQTAPTAAASASAPADLPGDTDWTLLAALAALLGIGGAGAYAVTRRSKSQSRQPAEQYRSDPVPASVTDAIMPELRGDTVDAEMRTMAEAKSVDTADMARSLSAKSDFAQFVANLPAFESPRSKADRSVTNGDRRIGAAPKPYVTEADLYRPDGYFTANVNSMPTAQNPFLTRHKRLIRAQYLDGKMAEMKMQASTATKPTRVAGSMQVSRALEPAYS